jgi:DNA-binding XRE family transcriptional regulator
MERNIEQDFGRDLQFMVNGTMHMIDVVLHERFRPARRLEHRRFTLGLEHTIARNVRRLRRLRYLTQRQLADLAGLQCQHVTRIEAGERAISTRTIQRLANALRVSVRTLIDKPK